MSKVFAEREAVEEAIKNYGKRAIEDGRQQLDTVDDIISICKAVAALPAADVMAVVKCKDCRHLMFSDCYGECSKGYMGIVSPNDFCSKGQRKDGGD